MPTPDQAACGAFGPHRCLREEWLVIDHDCGEPSPTADVAGHELVNQRVTCYEPTIARAADGALLVTVLGSGAPVYRIRGDAVERLPPVPFPPDVPPPATGWRYGGDSILETGPDGRVYFSALLPDGIQVASSADAGATWDRNVLIAAAAPGYAELLQADRQWLAFGSDAIYLSFRGLGGVAVMRSADGGLAWSVPVLAYPVPDVVAGRAVVLADGGLCVPVSDPPAMLVACSADDGATFASHQVAAVESPSLFPMVAQDDDGSLAHAWVDGGVLRVASSHDGGRTWSPPGDLMSLQVNGVWLQAVEGKVLAFGMRLREASVLQGWVARASPGAPAGFTEFAFEGGAGTAGTDHPHFLVHDGMAYAVLANGHFVGATSQSLWLLRFPVAGIMSA